MPKRLLLIFALISILLAGCGSSPQEDFERRVGQAMQLSANDTNAAAPFEYIRRLTLASATNDTASITPDQLFDWAEASFFQVFYKRETSLSWSTYRFRYYWMTDTYLAVDDKNSVFVLGNVTKNQIIQLGKIEDFSKPVREWLNRDRPFALNYTKTIDLVPYYEEICPQPEKLSRNNFRGRHLQNVIPTDLNNDGKIDFILNIWCNPVANYGIPYTGPTPSRLIALRQRSDGLFVEDTASFFRAGMITTGGIEENYITHDFNKDGYLDIILPLGREDGRLMSGEPGQGLSTQSVAIMSKGDGTYNTLLFGASQWALKATRVNTKGGNVEFIISSENTRLWSYVDGTFKPVNGFYGWVTNGTLFFNPTNPSSGSEIALQSGNGSLVGVVVRKREANGEWVAKGSWGWESKPLRYVFGSQGGAITDGKYITIDGKDYLNPALVTSCELQRTPKGSSEAIFLFSGMEIQGGYKGQVVEDQYSNELSFLIGFGIDENLNPRRTSLSIKNEIKGNTSVYRMECKDINGDGYQDIILYSTTNAEPERKNRAPIIYLNDGYGSFGLIDRAIFPVSPWFGGKEDAGQSNFIFEDLDGDGIPELIYYPINGGVGESINLFIHKGLRRLNQSDVLK